MTTSALPSERKGSGVRAAGETLRTYNLTVIANDVESVVAAAGGWLCDRMRAGWRVTARVPAGHDVHALTILGVRAEPVESVVDALRGLSTVAIAVDARILRHDERVRRELLRLVDDERAEVTLWGESTLFESDARFQRVRHPLSVAARAYKSRALRATGQTQDDGAVEEFLGAALWYSPDGADLVPLARR